MTYHSKITDKEKFEYICNLTTSLVGLRKGALAFKTRKQEIQLPRLVASNIGRLSGIHQRAIADVLKRDRSLIYHYENQHSANYTSWNDYREMFNLVYKAFQEVEESKPAFKDSRGMKRHLLEFVEESEPYQVEILIRSGSVGCKIKTSYVKFSYILKNIKFALANFRHSIDVNLL
jgi:hypothetical protein